MHTCNFYWHSGLLLTHLFSSRGKRTRHTCEIFRFEVYQEANPAVRSRQSYGIPVGSSASRIIAEAILTDVDDALVHEEVAFTRYVDDYRIFIRPDQNPYRIIAFLSEQLAKNEGLSLNAQKTRLLTAKEFLANIEAQLHVGSGAAAEAAVELLGDALYSDEEPNASDVDRFKMVDFLGLLREEVGKDHWDFALIKSIFSGLRLVNDVAASEFITAEVSSLMPRNIPGS